MEQVYLTLGAIIRNQEHYVKEWLAFYHLLGVERFCIALHNCTDKTVAKIKELPFQDKILLFQTRSDAKAVQMGVYKKINEQFGRFTKWMLFIDSDEFLFPKTVSTLSEFLTHYENYSSLSVNQRIFGHANHVVRPQEGLVIENYVWATFPPEHSGDKFVKTIFQPKYLLGLCSPHFQVCHTLPQVRTDKKGFKLHGNCATGAAALHDLAQYNHYYTKSMEDWLDRYNRGSCNDPRANDYYDVEDFFNKGQRAIISEEILKFAIPIRELLEMPYHKITPHNMKAVTIANVKNRVKSTYSAVSSGRKNHVKIISHSVESAVYRNSVQSRLFHLHSIIKEELKKGTEYILFVEGNDSLFIDSIESICDKLKIVYKGKVLCCTTNTIPYLQNSSFQFHLYGKYKRYGFAHPCMFFGETALVDELFNHLTEIYNRFQNKQPVTEVEKYISRLDEFQSPLSTHLEDILFLWHVYQANGEHYEIQPDGDLRFFARITSVPEYNIDERQKITKKGTKSFIGQCCIVNIDTKDTDSRDTWARDNNLLMVRDGNVTPDYLADSLWEIWDSSVLMTNADRNIIDNRTAVFRFHITDSSGTPLPKGTPVKITMKRHEFQFGLQHLRFNMFGTDEINKEYEKWAVETINKTTIHTSWKYIEPAQGQFMFGNLKRDLDNAKRYSLSTLAHCLFWDNAVWFRPAWIPPSMDHNEYLNLWQNYVNKLAEQCGDQVNEWHVTNESVSKEDGELDQRIVVKDGFFKAFDYASKTLKGKLGACFYQDIFQSIYKLGTESQEYQIVCDLLDRQAKVDFISLQFHVHDSRWIHDAYNPYHIQDAIETLSILGLPINIAELGIYLGVNIDDIQYRDCLHDPILQAMLVKNVYRFLFSLPQVQSITYWQEFMKQGQGQGLIASKDMLTDDQFNPYPAHTELTTLITQDWMTREEGVTDENGDIEVRCFYGDYDIEVSSTSTFSVRCGSKSDRLINLKTTP
jgi:GH35 family endo-1,4-beta-xylanase